MLTVLYVKQPDGTFAEVADSYAFTSIQQAIDYFCDSNLTNTRDIYKATMPDTGASKIFSKCRR